MTLALWPWWSVPGPHLLRPRQSLSLLWTHLQRLSQYCHVAGSSPAVSSSASSPYLDHWILEADASVIQPQGLNCHIYAGDSQSSISRADLCPEFHIHRTSYLLTVSIGCVTHTHPVPVCTPDSTVPPATWLPSKRAPHTVVLTSVQSSFMLPIPWAQTSVSSLVSFPPHSHSFEILLTLPEKYIQNLKTLCSLISNPDTVV